MGLFRTPVNIERQISVFLLFLLTFTMLTHFPGPSVVYIVSLIHWMYMLLGVVKLASRKNWKDYGVLRTCIRELKVKR